MSDDGDWLPGHDERSAPFFDGAREGRLMLQHCDACGAWHWPVRRRCHACGADELCWREASGRGVVYTHGRLHRPSHPRHEARGPLLLALVDLEEGVRAATNLVDVSAREVRAGMPVEVRFEALPGGGALPVFGPAAAGRA